MLQRMNVENQSAFTSTSGLLVCIFVAGRLLLAGDEVFAQGHYEASPAPSIKISRSSEHKTESKEFEVPVDVELEYKSAGCEAKLNIEYFQSGENAEVSSTVINNQCAASFGSYTVQVRYRGDDGELETRNYEETWERGDADPVLAKRQYFIGENVDLVRVQSRGLTCSCVSGEPAASEDRQ